MDDWYTAVYALPTVWPDVSMMGMNNMRKVVGYHFHYMRKKYRVPGMWGTVRPQWPLLKQHLETTGPGWYSAEGLRSVRRDSLPTGPINLGMI